MKRNKAREVIIKTASGLFYKQGYSNTGINQIIEEAGIAKSTLYEHFQSKEDLFITYLNETGAATLEVLKEVSKNGTTAKDKVLAIFTYLEELVVRIDFYGCHFLNIIYEMPDGEEMIRTQIKKQKDRVRELFAMMLQSPDNPSLADDIYTLFEGVLIAHKVHKAPWPVTAAKNVIKKLM